MNILVVDDEKMIAAAIQRVLQKNGHHVDSANNGLEAIKKLQDSAAGTYQIAILDLLMPELNGSDVLDWIRGHRPNIKVIMMTAYGDASTRAELIKRGASQVLSKPFEDILIFSKLIQEIE